MKKSPNKIFGYFFSSSFAWHDRNGGGDDDGWVGGGRDRAVNEFDRLGVNPLNTFDSSNLLSNRERLKREILKRNLTVFSLQARVPLSASFLYRK